MNEFLKRILAVEDLPSPPGVALRLLEIYNQAEIEVSEMSKVISADPVLAAKLIDYCNSPILARARRTSSIDQAIVALGLRAVKMIGLSFSLIQTSASEESQFDYDAFWNRSMATAIAARTLSSHLKGDKETVFLLGLVLNIGQLAMAHVLQGEYLVLMDSRNVSELLAAEVEKWGVDHYEIGGQMLCNWKFPEDMANVILKFGQLSEKPDEVISVLQVAEQVSELLFNPETRIERLEEVKANAIAMFNLEDDVFDQIFDDSVVYWVEYAKLLNFDSSNQTTFAGLEGKARRGIAQLSMGLHAENEKVVEENIQLKSNIIVDPLTGLKNRRAYTTEVAAELERCKRSRSTFVMMVADIDKFKLVNDTYGHAAGDKILVAVAEALIDHSRRYDSVYRIGGEEFVIVLADCDVHAALSAAERFRKSVESLDLQTEGTRIPVTVSIGINCIEAGGQTVEEVFHVADRLMYKAKASGRNQCCIAEIDPIPALQRNQIPMDLTASLNGQPM